MQIKTVRLKSQRAMVLRLPRELRSPVSELVIFGAAPIPSCLKLSQFEIAKIARSGKSL